MSRIRPGEDRAGLEKVKVGRSVKGQDGITHVTGYRMDILYANYHA